MNALSLQMLSKLSELNAADLVLANECYKTVCDRSSQLNRFCDFMAKLPTVDPNNIPKFCVPSSIDSEITTKLSGATKVQEPTSGVSLLDEPIASLVKRPGSIEMSTINIL
eukprot:GHVO01020565.1.p1 GENE.GHVO01020565.1~~GHVO01020565.1.p1  ORF type:complete len:111 (+),score=12.20 GHVO01020565.1:211-543(+)